MARHRKAGTRHQAGSGWRAALARYQWWEVMLGLTGLLSFLSLLVIFFLPIAKGPLTFHASARVPAAGTPAFVELLSHSMTLPVDHGPPVRVLENGDAFRDALLADIDRATASIHIMVYIWKDGRFSDLVLDHLLKKQRQGVAVRLLVDAYGAASAPDDKFDALKKAGGKVGIFNSLLPLPWKIARTAKRNHRRAFVIDGRIGYTGGAAIDDVWLGNARTPEEWRDLMFRVEGPMVGRLQGSFAETWAMLDGELLAGEAVFPSLPQAQAGDVVSIPLSSSPSPDIFEDQTFVLLSLLAAQRQIVIETPYFLSDPALREILKSRARAGVSVRIIVPDEHNDQKFVRWAGQRVYAELMEAGIQIHEFQPTFTHAKFMVVDGVWSVVGSANMDHRSRKINNEILFGIRDEELARTLLAVFDKDLRQSRQVTLDAWRKRGPLQRGLELAAQIFVQQY